MSSGTNMGMTKPMTEGEIPRITARTPDRKVMTTPLIRMAVTEATTRLVFC